ncbi:Uncharacterised protein [Burkholderia oklahomensis]|nr:hypothetical protein BG90_5245 [Burkholderia oklahomensis C6786]SUY26985.1 Uncharacterised protein [Burkholderia oklahomensis]
MSSSMLPVASSDSSRPPPSPAAPLSPQVRARHASRRDLRDSSSRLPASRERERRATGQPIRDAKLDDSTRPGPSDANRSPVTRRRSRDAPRAARALRAHAPDRAPRASAAADAARATRPAAGSATRSAPGPDHRVRDDRRGARIRCGHRRQLARRKLHAHQPRVRAHHRAAVLDRAAVVVFAMEEACDRNGKSSRRALRRDLLDDRGQVRRRRRHQPVALPRSRASAHRRVAAQAREPVALKRRLVVRRIPDAQRMDVLVPPRELADEDACIAFGPLDVLGNAISSIFNSIARRHRA